MTRICCLLIRFLFDLLSSVPAEFIVTTRNSAIRLLHLALVKGYNIPIDASFASFSLLTSSIEHRPLEPTGVPQLMEFVAAIERQSQQRIRDLAHVVVDALLSFYGPTQQTARTLVEEFHSILGEGEVIDALRGELKQRAEFQKVSVLPPQMQMRWV